MNSVLPLRWDDAKMKLFMIAVGSLFLAGCATTPADCNMHDRNASLLNKLSCETSGAYSQQIREREQELIRNRELNKQFRQVYDDIVVQRDAMSGSLAAQRQSQSALNASLGALLGQLKSGGNQKAEVQQQIAALERQLKQVASASTGTTSASIPQRQQTLKALQQQVDRLQRSLGYN
jgi:chromosome segregation ATPase